MEKYREQSNTIDSKTVCSFIYFCILSGMMKGREVGANENRWQEEEGETGEKRAGCGSSQRVGSTRNSGSYATILIDNYCC